MKNTFKRRLPIMIALVAAISLFSVTALAFSNNNSGYETLKTALKSAKQADNATFDVQMEVFDNGNSIVAVGVRGKMDEASQNASGQLVVTANDVTQTVDLYKTGDTAIFVDKGRDLYYQVNDANGKDMARHHEFKNENFTMTSAQEAFVDYLAGNLKNQIGQVENSDGTKTLTLNLEKKDVPMALNLAISAATSAQDMKDAAREERMNKEDQILKDIPFFNSLKGLDTALPELKEDVKVTAIAATLTLDAQNQMTAYNFSITVEGKEANQTAHSMTFNSTGKVSDLNATTVDTIDVTGKDLQVIDLPEEDYNHSEY